MKTTAAHAAAIDEMRNIYRSRRVLPATASDSERDRIDAACDAASAHVEVHEALAKWEESKQALDKALAEWQESKQVLAAGVQSPGASQSK